METKNAEGTQSGESEIPNIGMILISYRIITYFNDVEYCNTRTQHVMCSMVAMGSQSTNIQVMHATVIYFMLHIALKMI
jgi:hypothetical protein